MASPVSRDPNQEIDLYGDIPTEPRVARMVNLSDTVRAEGGDDFVGAEPGSRR
jgi:hypothetical protein